MKAPLPCRHSLRQPLSLRCHGLYLLDQAALNCIVDAMHPGMVTAGIIPRCCPLLEMPIGRNVPPAGVR